MTSRSPDFLCIGAQKAGTTWLYENLRNHPSIWLPPIKEVQYFNEIWLPHQRQWTSGHRDFQALDHLEWYFSKPRDEWDMRHVEYVCRITSGPISDDWYRAIFSHAPKNSLAGELTPEYALLPDLGLQHIRRLNNDIKIIFLVRDPIERAWSHANMLIRQQGLERTTASFEAIIDSHDVVERSDYADTLDSLERNFPKSNCLWMSLDHIRDNPGESLATTFAFLGVDTGAIDETLAGSVIHSGGASEIPKDILAMLWNRLGSCYNKFEKYSPELVNAWRTMPR